MGKSVGQREERMVIFLKRIVKGLFRVFGIEVSRKPRATRPTSMESAFQLIRTRGHSIGTVIDVGASDGRWSASFERVYPDCRYFLIEAQPVHEKELEEFCRKRKNAEFVLAAAGEKPGRVYFDASSPFAGQASYRPYPSHNIEVPVVAIENEVRARSLPGPYLLKLDTHGFEVPILNGARGLLADTEVIVMECYNFDIGPESRLFYEMCAYLRELKFRCIHLVDPVFRPYDGSFWQMDLVFVKEDRPEFRHVTYA
jgi:FkbM family methyltransferase